MKTAILYVEDELLKELVSLLTQVGPEMRDVEFDEEVKFEDGFRMAIQLCKGDRETTPWTQALLYDENGVEQTFTDVMNHIQGSFELEGHTVFVKPESARKEEQFDNNRSKFQDNNGNTYTYKQIRSRS